MWWILYYVASYTTINFIINNINFDLLQKNNNDYLITCTEIPKISSTIETTGLLLFSSLISYNYFSILKNNFSTTLLIIFFNYLLSSFNSDKLLVCNSIIKREIMWIYTTTIFILMFCETIYKNISDVQLYKHVLSIVIKILSNLFFICGYNYLGYFGICISTILQLIFTFNLIKYNINGFTYSLISVWCFFYILYFIDFLNYFFLFLDQTTIYNMYLINDIVAKVSINTLFTNNLLKIENLRNNMDLQTINFTSYMLNNINQYYENNSIITKECSNFIENIRNNFITVIPKNKDVIKIELLNKILPLNLVNKYIFENKNNTKHYTNICVLFTDIVNYTELAKKYKHDIIFELLNILYTKFDNIIKKYSHLQKIETIGDAYMVVGDIFRNDDNYKIVIKEIILIAFDFINEIKNIKTPDKNPLSIRIGINLGNVSIGILGTELPRLCVVGNTVNMASRLQSTADPDTIQISHHIYEQLEEMDLKNKFEICKKENVFLKNIGSVTTYIVTPIISN